jgi:hypothetical protein
MDRDEKNASNNQWLLRNYDKIKLQEIHNLQKKTDVLSCDKQPYTKQGKKTDKSSSIVQTVNAMHNSGLTQKKISELLSISIGSVNRLLHLK